MADTTRYTCPMHPAIVRDAPGKCPICGMALVPVNQAAEQHVHHHHGETHPSEQANHEYHEPSGTHKGREKHGRHSGHNGQHGYDKHAGHHSADFLKRFRVCIVVTVPVLLLSHMIQRWLGFSFSFPGSAYLLLVLSSFIFIYGGMPFLRGMVSEIKGRAIGMMTLVAIAITVAWLYSTAVVFGLKGMDFYWELATLIDIMLLGHWLEMRSQMAASRALEGLVALLPAIVHVEKNGVSADIALKELRTGDIALVKPGEQIPADGKVLDGLSYVNESMLTGESVPVKKEKDQKVIGGSINGNGALRVMITATGPDSYLDKVIHLVSSAQAARSKTQNLADRVAGWLTIVSLTVGAATFVIWMDRQNDMAFALERMVTVMVTACPHALGVAIPLVVAISTTLSATHGLLIRNRTAFETARKLNTIIFDKTGTITKGTHEVQQVISLDNTFNPDTILQYAAAVQQNSEHHIARGILAKLRDRKLELWPVTGFNYMAGVGVRGEVKGKQAVCGGPNYFLQNKIALPSLPSTVDRNLETIVYLLIEGKPSGIFSLADTIRESAPAAIRDLKQMHIKSYLLTGDNEHVAKSVADKLGMDGYFANVLPHEKQERIKAFQLNGELVAMTGDGVNDAPALAQADVGIAVGSGTDIAAETADIILVNSDPIDVVGMIAFARATYRKMIQNLAWAVGYNFVAIPLAAGVLYPRFMLSPALGAVLMSLSTIIVAFNALGLKRKLKKGGNGT